MPNWTDEQLEAINAIDEPIIVSAAAGSGKTAVLVERTIRLLCDEEKRIPADKLLAVTFTNDAASQMREKLSDALEKKATEEPDNSWIQKQQSLLKLADICTINSFCFDMVRNRLEETDFQSGVRIMEENESGMLAERALTAVLENAYRDRPEETERLISLFCKENDSTLRAMILKLYDFLRTLPFKDVWADKILTSFKDGTALESVINGRTADAVNLCKNLRTVSLRLRNLAESLEYHKSAQDIFIASCDQAESLCDIPKNHDWDECREILSDISWKGLQSARQSKAEKAKSTAAEDELYESAKDCYNRLKEVAAEISGIYFCTVADAEKDAELSADCFSSLMKLTNELWDEVMRLKVEKNAVDFADTELITVRLLAECDPDGKIHRTKLSEEIRNSGMYSLILIDEFQDVNNLQEVIFKSISDTNNLGEIGSNVFAVGDVKQAIYRFRQANPMIFMNTRLQGKSPDSPVREIILSKNFRSRNAVLDFSNYIFSSLMTTDLGEVEYTKEEELVCGAQYEGVDQPCTIIEVDCEGKNSAETEELEYTAIARRIRKMINDGVTVTDGGVRRPCRAGDFCVLSRNNPDGELAVECFEAEGLKIASTSVSGYLGSREISLLINLLSITVSPMRDIPMSSIMLSPIMGFTDDELARVKLFDKKHRLYRNMLDISEDSSDPVLQAKCSQAVALIKKLRLYSSSMTLTRLIKKIYDITDLISLAASYEDGDKKTANLYLMLEYARSYEESSKDGLNGFLRYIDYISQNGGDFNEAVTVTESQDAVSFKTIHKSKGLEYPFVFICRLSKKFNKKDLYGRLILNTDAGVGMSFLDYGSLTKRKTIFSEYVESKNLSEMLSEELRLLYVAMTRAKEQLFIVYDIDEKTAERAVGFSYEIAGSKIPSSLSSRAQCMQDWVTMAMCKHPGFKLLREALPDDAYADTSRVPDISEEMPLEVSQLDDAKSIISEVKPDEDLKSKILQSFKFRNDPVLTSTEAKVTVSELASDDPVNFFPKVPKLKETVTELTAAQKGTLMHRFMQCADYSLAAKDVETEIRRLTDSGIFSEHEAKSLDRESLSKFFGSDIYRRMSKSPNVSRERSFIVKFTDIEASYDITSAYGGTDGMMQGIADCIFEEPDGYVIVDYKTDKVQTIEELANRYSMQLSLYKAAFDVLLDKPVKSCYIYSLRLAEGLEIVI
ncbi:MAG: UvrD-helicase domain-containing protein [Oscillospiraceae bacterium]|nr:UvrD-helicase domain-containing protein [Oscillospiraceae bacterium]